MDMQKVGEDFALYYYETFDNDRSQLESVYHDDSMLTFEGEQFYGVQAIMTKIVGLNFTSVKHVPQTCDVQPSPGGGVILFVSGSMYIDYHVHADVQPVKFAQVFQLVTLPGTTQFVVSNDMFRLNYA